MADVLMVYWSGTGNTEIMAEKIQEGLIKSGNTVKIVTVDEIEPQELESFDKIAFGCPSMGEDELEETEFEPFFEIAETLISGKKIALFGSYGWGEGEWMELWEDRVISSGAILFEKGMIANYTPGDEEEEACIKFGEKFGAF